MTVSSLSLSIYIVQVLDAPPPLLYKNIHRPAVEGLMSVHAESRKNHVTEEMSAEVTSLVLSSLFSLCKSFFINAYAINDHLSLRVF